MDAIAALDTKVSSFIDFRNPETVKRLTIQEALDGSSAEWMEHVSDEQYLK
jgi:hypothetical protein